MSIILYIYINIPCGTCTLEFVGITGMKRWQKKKKWSLHLNKVVYFTVVKKRERDYALTTGLYNPFERQSMPP